MSGKWSDSLFDRIVRQMQGLPPPPPQNGEMVPPPMAPPVSPPQLPEMVPAGPRALTAPPSVAPGAGIAPWMALLGESAVPAIAGAAAVYPREANPAGLADTPPAPTSPQTVMVQKSPAANFGTPVADSGPKSPSAPAQSQGAGSILNEATKKTLDDVKSLDDLGDRINARMKARQGIEAEMKQPPAQNPGDIQSMKQLQERVNARLKQRQQMIDQMRKGQ